jgi:predicted AAA+ superfamily ATPase
MAEEKLINRPEYLEKLKKWQKDPDMIKIITGVRRCGKSKLFTLIQRDLQKNGVSSAQIQQIDFDLDDNRQFLDREFLYKHILDNLVPDKMNYVFLDEIQLVKDWQKTANSLRAKDSIDLYLTGSNAYMFSGKLSTLIGGRYIEVRMQPLSFREFVVGSKELRGIEAANDISKEYDRYTTESGFPQTLKYDGDMQLIGDYLMDSVYRNTINKDIIKRYKLKDTAKLDNVVRYLFDNIAKETSILNIEKTLGGKVSNDSIDKYVDGLLDSYLLCKCERMDLKGKKILNTTPKYYACDAGLRGAVLGHRIGDTGRILENVVYLELLRRGYDVYVGKIGKKQKNGEWREIEVDFVAAKANGVREYYQVATTILDESVMAREIGSLEEIKDNYPKYLLTLDSGGHSHEGIKQLNVLDWLMGRCD